MDVMRGSRQSAPSSARAVHGNNVITVTPFDASLELDERSFCRQLDFVLANGADGVVVLGTTGEFFSLDPAEKARVVELAARQVRGRATLIVGVGGTCLREAIDLGRLARAQGADAILAPAPYFLNWAAAGLTEYFVELARGVGLDLMIYDGAGGNEIPLDVLEAVAARTDRFRYLKLTTRDVTRVCTVTERCDGRVAVFAGEDTLIVQELLAGAVGVVTAAGLLNSGAINEVIRHFRAGVPARAQAVHDRWIAPQAIVTGAILREFIQCFKVALCLLKVIDCDAIRPPLVALGVDRRRAVELMLQNQGKC